MLTKIKRSKRKGFARAFWLFSDGSDGVESGGGGNGSSEAASLGEGGSGSGDVSLGNGNGGDGLTALNQGVEIDLESAVAEHDKETEKSKWDDLIPEEYREKPYIQNILKSEKPNEQLFKEFDGLQKKLGERSNLSIPKEDAGEEEWNKFYQSLGRPEKADDYTIDKPTWGDEDKDIGKFIEDLRGNENFEKDVKTLFHKAGLTPQQVKILAPGFDEVMVKNNREFFQQAAGAQTELERDYSERMKDIFGNRAEKVNEVGRKLIRENAPDNVKKMVDELDNKSQAILAAVLDNINKKYIKEDGKVTAGGTSGNEQTVREEGRKLMAHPAFTDVEHPLHDTINAQVKAHYAMIV